MATKHTIRDVALNAGVSTATVSHVLNSTRYVSDETREKVLQSMRDLNYNPNITARILKTGKKKIVGFVTPNIRDEFFSTLTEECEKVLSEQDYRLLIMNTREDPEREKACLNYLARGTVDGILLASTLKSYQSVEQILDGSVPVVCLDRYPADCSCDIVHVNTDDALSQGLTELVAHGCKKIAFFDVHEYISTSVERRDVYLSTMESNGLESFLIPLSDMTNTMIDSYMNDIMCQHFDAIVTPNNFSTIGALNYMLAHKVEVGKDLRLVAFQDTAIPYILLHNAYVIKQPTQRMGRDAASLLLERIENPNMPNIVKELIASYEYRT